MSEGLAIGRYNLTIESRQIVYVPQGAKWMSIKGNSIYYTYDPSPMLQKEARSLGIFRFGDLIPIQQHWTYIGTTDDLAHVFEVR